MAELTEKQKETILLKNKWEKIVGYAFDYGWDNENIRSVIITKKEIEDFLKTEPRVYWWHNEHGYEYCQDLEGAWEYFLDDYCEDGVLGDWNKSEEQLLKELEGE